ncbi:MAG: hypothetical protein Q9190_000735 [Brigantiaea leucoxantha]
MSAAQEIDDKYAELERKLADAHRMLAEMAVSIEQAETLNRPTTLEVLLEQCHEQLFKRFAVQPDPSKTTTGGITSPVGRPCPKVLRPWTDFPHQQLNAFDNVYSRLHPPDGDAARLFNSLTYIKESGQELEHMLIGSEEGLRFFQYRAVEVFVAKILTSLGPPVQFDHNKHTLGDQYEIQQRRQQLHHRREIPTRVNPDQLCVYKMEDGATELLLVVEYKAPHKITKECFRAALNGVRDLNMLKVRDQDRIPINARKNFIYKARQLVAAAATQTYQYMLETGCEYSCIATGESIVFLRIEEEDTNTLYYHLAEPALEVSHDTKSGFPHPKTAIGQLLSFCIMASQSSRRNEEWRRAALRDANVWEVDYEKILQKTPKALRELLDYLDEKTFKEDLAFKGRKIVSTKNSPYNLRKRRQQRLQHGCSAPMETVLKDREDSHDRSGESPDEAETPSKPSIRLPTRSKVKKQQPQAGYGTTGKQQDRQYCTQACILGLVHRRPIDRKCPNAELHPQNAKENTHSLSKLKLCYLIRQQLAKTMDEDCVDLRLLGARGMLFQLTLASHGYTFVGKGTIDVFISDLKHEGQMYHRLQKLQGKQIPVYLGNIDLDVPWYDLNTHVIHMLLMSYGGEQIKKLDENLALQVQEFEKVIGRLGVCHEDLREPNMLWNKELERLMFIDFERSTTINNSRALIELAPNLKRKVEQGQASTTSSVTVHSKTDENQRILPSKNDKNQTTAVDAGAMEWGF